MPHEQQKLQGAKMMRRTAFPIMMAALSLQVAESFAAQPPVARSKSNPKLLSFRGNDHLKLLGYDYYDLLNTDKVHESLGWRTEADRNRPAYEPFFDMLARNRVNFTRCFVWDGWGNDLFCWKRVSTPDDPIKQGQRYALVDLSQFDERFWTHAIKAIEYASKKGVIVEVTLYDRCGIDSDSISPRRWSFHPWNSDNSLPGTIGYDLFPKGKERGISYVFDLANLKVKSLHEAYLKKWVDSTRHLDNVIFEIENEGYSGYKFNKWVAEYLRHTLKCPFVIAVNTFADKDLCHAIPEVDMIADHGEKSPKEVDQLQAQWAHFDKVIMVDTDGWRSSEQDYQKSLQTAQHALDIDLHFNHKARSNKPCGDTGKRYVELMAGIQSDPAGPAPYRLDTRKVNQESADIILDSKNVEKGLRLGLPWDGSADGWTVVVERQGKNGRMNTSGPNGRKGRTIFFDADDAFLFKGTHPKVQIEVEYYDSTPGDLVLEYDAAGDAEAQRKTAVFKCPGTTDWQHATFNLDDTYFGNRCGEHADFGFRRGSDGGEIVIRQVWVRKANR
jgi:hypothetical protein